MAFNQGQTLPQTYSDDINLESSPFNNNIPPYISQYNDANMENPPYNQGYFGFDPYDQYVGKYTAIDEIHDVQNQTNAMDDNWEGNEYSQYMFDRNTLSLQ